MPLFITYASYSHSGVRGLVNKPEDRSGAVKALIEKAGGKLVALYNTTGSMMLCSFLSSLMDRMRSPWEWLLPHLARYPRLKQYALGRRAN